MKRVAAIDIGTNTALLLIAEVTNHGDILPLVQEERIVRLGEDVDKTNILKEEAMAKTLQALHEYLKITDAFDTEKVIVSGTSAVRDARNRNYFIKKLKKEFGIELQVLTGDDEARLTYWGALSNKHDLDGEILLIDIGGGSTECILGKRSAIKKAMSLNIGSVRLTERCVKHDPVTEDEFKMIHNLVNEQIHNIVNVWHFKPKHFVGVAGTVTTLAAINLQLNIYDSELVDNSVLTRSQIAEIVDDLKTKTIQERRRMPGLKPERADVILAGAIILLAFMRQFNFEKVIVSDRGLRFGLLLKFFGERGL